MKLKPALLLIFTLAASGHAALPDAERAVILSETLGRLDAAKVNSDPTLKAALEKPIASARGTPQFVQLVQKFNVPGQSAALLDFALNHPNDDQAGPALRQVFVSRDIELVKSALNGPKAAQTIEALGNLTHKRASALLVGVVTDAKRAVSLRTQAVKALALTQPGAEELIALAKAHTLAGELQEPAGKALSSVRWAPIREEAAKLFTADKPATATELPPVSELLKRTGDAANGAKVFRRDTVGCIKCHQINGEGVDFGPALSEIGTKLGKDAIYDSIINPSAGVSFGFEAWELELKNGDEFYGILVDQTAEELTVKDARAIATKVKKAAVKKQTQSKLSIMPAGLPQLITTQELVDVVEYLSTLKKK